MTTLAIFDGIGVAAGTQMDVGIGGSGDSSIDAVFGEKMVKVTTDPTFADSFDLAPEPTSSAYAEWALGTNVKNLGVRFYFKKISTWSNAAWQTFAFRDTDTASAAARHAIGGSGNPGQVRFLDATGVTTSSSNSLYMTDQWVRIEVYIKADTTTTGQWRNLAYLGDSTTPLYDSGWRTGQNVGIGVEKARWGLVQTPMTGPGTFRLAHLVVTNDADTLIGPWVAPAPPASDLPLIVGTGKVSITGFWDGTTFQPAEYVTVVP